MKMTPGPTRRDLIAGTAATAIAGVPALAGTDPIARYRTPHKLGRLVLGPSDIAGDFAEKQVDCPFVFRHLDGYRMLHIGWDGTGYQTGLADSTDLVTWANRRLILARDVADPDTRYNIAMNTILREPQLFSPGRLEKVRGRYLGAWHAYPEAGLEAGPAVIGLAWSDDLEHWEKTAPILQPDPRHAWEAGGLYKPYLIRDGDTFYLFYNAKTKSPTGEFPWYEQTGVAMSRDLKTWTRHPGNPVIRNGDRAAPDAQFASDPCVFRDGKRWVAYYFGLAHFTPGTAIDMPACELLAVGDSPFRLTKVLIDVGKPGAIDDRYAHKPSVIARGGDLYHFSTAVRAIPGGEHRGISVARSRPW